MELGYLISPVVQIVDNNGKPVVGAKIYVYNAGTTVLVNTYNDFEYHLNTNPVITDTLGNCTIIADNSRAYDIVVNDENDILMFSKKNITVSSGTGSSSSFIIEPGEGIAMSQEGNVITISVDTDTIATQEDLVEKQDKLYAGTDLKITNDVISVDTNGMISSGTYNFIAGKDTRISGNYNAVFGETDTVNGAGNIVAGSNNKVENNGANNAVFGMSNSAAGRTNLIAGAGHTVSGNYVERNAIFGLRNKFPDIAYSNLVFGADNTVNGSCNIIGGQQCEVAGTNNVVIGQGNTITGSNYINNTVIGKYADTSFDDFFVIGNGTSNTAKSNVFEVRKTDEIYYKYNNSMVRLEPSTIPKWSQSYADIPNDGTTVVIKTVTATTDSFVIEGLYDTSTNNYKINIRNTNTYPRTFTVFDNLNNPIHVSTTATIYEGYVQNQFKFDIYGMGTGYDIPMGEYILYFLRYTNRLNTHIFEVHAYGI